MHADDKIDEEIVGLCEELNKWPGIQTLQSCASHVKSNSTLTGYVTFTTYRRHPMAPDPDTETTIHVIAGMLIGLLIMFVVWLTIFGMAPLDAALLMAPLVFLPILLFFAAYPRKKKEESDAKPKNKPDDH